MRQNEFKEEWMSLASDCMISMVDLDYIEQDLNTVYRSIMSTFEALLKLKSFKLYKPVELETIFYLIRMDIFIIEDITKRYDKEVRLATWEAIWNIFEELVQLSEEFEFYETCRNLLNFRQLWLYRSRNNLISNFGGEGEDE